MTMPRFEGIRAMYATDTLCVGGSFADLGQSGYIADHVVQWNGLDWGGPGIAVYRGICHCCGEAPGDVYACEHCGAPTARWWARLDEMIATWKRGYDA